MENKTYVCLERDGTSKMIGCLDDGFTLVFKDGSQIVFDVDSPSELIDWFEKTNKKLNDQEERLNNYEIKGRDLGGEWVESWEERYNKMAKIYEHRIDKFNNKNIFRRIILAIKRGI